MGGTLGDAVAEMIADTPLAIAVLIGVDGSTIVWRNWGITMDQEGCAIVAENLNAAALTVLKMEAGGGHG